MAADDEEGIRFFENKIRPLLVNHCYECHGSEKQESELRLDTVAGLRRGGATGMAVVPGEPDQSLLLTAVSYLDEELQMPPEVKLTDQEIADLQHWIEIGAPHPDTDKSVPTPRGGMDLDEARSFWAFQPPRQLQVPLVSDVTWPTSPLDYFVLAELESRELQPAGRADRRTLIRRVTLDLTGLPPTPQEVESFVADESPGAYVQLIDRLLGSVHYGQRWGRHWLDVARYADSNGLDENVAHGNAWRYRDYVIAAFNLDKPFDEFVVEQLAGDLLPVSQRDQIQHARLVATGFLTLGPKVLAEGDEDKMVMDIVDEQIDTFGRTFLGVTLGCARCHDHKFDPVSTRDYYALAGIFKSTRTMESTKRIARWTENSIATREQRKLQEIHEKRLADQNAEIARVVNSANKALLAGAGTNAQVSADAESRYPTTVKQALKKLRDGLVELEKSAPVIPTAMGVTDGDVADARIHVRGSHLTLGQPVPRGIPRVLAFDGQPAVGADRSGRLELAHWLVRPEHPLTSRVLVNRIWRWHFGRGLVASADNFGKLGERPTNQPLLDWLAVQFIESGWSIKQLHRLILLSSTYQMSSDFDAANARIDPENLVHWRHNIRRLEAEMVRDSLLAASGLLDQSMGGSLLHVGNREFIFNHTSKDETSYDSHRRSVYLPVIRNHLYDVFSLFDYTDASVPNGDRPTSTVAPQALFMMNSDLILTVSQALADRLIGSDEHHEDRVNQLYLIALGRLPTGAERNRALDLVASIQSDFTVQSASDGADEHGVRRAWAALCQVVLASNEFVHIR